MNNEQLVENYSRLIYSIAKRYSYGNDLDDLYQVGMIGLINAYEKYDDISLSALIVILTFLG